MVVLEAPHYILLGVAGFFAIVWALVGMGVVKTRDHSLHKEKHAHLDNATRVIEETYRLMEHIPRENHDGIRAHLHRGEINTALESAKINHDVYHFFRDY
tara:strand:- start:1784 stop:2083 length:300 start_codon:yes stop_codon:yes gene_type:complete